jgi:hypothetical protein
MTAIALPRPRKRRSKPARVAKSVAKTWTSMKVGSAAAKTAKKGAKAWASFKVVKLAGKGGAKLLLIPLAAGGGVAAWKKVRSTSSDQAPATPYGSPVGPVATPATVTPPKTAPGSNAAVNGGDSPAGTPDPPVTPPGASA